MLNELTTRVVQDIITTGEFLASARAPPGFYRRLRALTASFLQVIRLHIEYTFHTFHSH
jgi:hypothetical protein